MPGFVPRGDLTDKRPFIPPSSIDIKVIETIPGRRTKRIGQYSATRYGRCVYGTESAVYGRDKYNQCTYE